MATKKKSQSKNAGDDKKKALDAAMAMIEKDYGKGAVMRLGDDNRPPIKVSRRWKSPTCSCAPAPSTSSLWTR